MVLEGAGLLLTSPNPDMAELVADYYRRNRDFLKSFDPEREARFFTAAHQREVLAEELEAGERGAGYRFYITRAARPEAIIGNIGLNNVVRGAFWSAFLGYKLDGACTNAGHMTAAVALVTDYAFTARGLHRIEANVMPKNAASLRVLEKNGYEYEGLARRYLRINGVWEDHIHMVKLNDGFKPAQS